MAETPSSMNIYQKISEIGKHVEVLQKNKAGYNYKYVTDELILAHIKGTMRKLGVSLIPNVVPGTTKVMPYAYKKTKSTRDGKVFVEEISEVLVSSDMEWHWVNNDQPDDRIVVPWTMVGQQADASQAFGSGLTYSSRYFLLKYFNVATTEDDPDNWRSRKKEEEDREGREIAEQVVAQIHQMVSEYRESHPEDTQKIVDVVKKYAKDKSGKPCANYNTIKDPVVAANLLSDLTELLHPEGSL